MRTVVRHMAGAIAFGALMALLVPAAPPSLRQYAVVAASAAANTGAVTKATGTTDGRWKLGGDGSCFFDPDDAGPDQCSPNLGRWKLGGDGSCYWDPADEGPNQCAPATSDGLDATDAKPTMSAQLRTAEFYSRA